MLRAAETIVRTDTGRHRSGNEDASLVRPPMFVLADGMGGAQSGEVASQIAIDAFRRGLPAEGTPEERLSAVVRSANEEIHRRSRAEAEHAGMGTTLTAAYLHGNVIAIAHVGDSRAYLLRGGELRRLTQDHSLVEELLRGGKLTEQQALAHPQRSIITRALGPELDVEVDTWSYALRADDVVLLCSDGLTDMVAEDRLRELLVGDDELDAVAGRLIDAANAAGGRDNITVVLFRVQAAGEELGLEQPTEREPGLSPAAVPPLTVTPPPGPVRRASLARRQGRRRDAADGRAPSGRPQRHAGRTVKVAAAILAVVAALFVVGGGGYLATRQLYFLGTNDQGTVVVYRGLPYVLPFGIPMYETFYVSGVPAQTLPADRRATLLDHAIHDQGAAITLINDLELGKISG